MGLWQLSGNSDSEMTQKVPETNSEITPENQWLQNLDVLLGRFIFRGKLAVSFSQFTLILPMAQFLQEFICENFERVSAVSFVDLLFRG